MLLDGPGCGGGTVEDGIVESAEDQLEFDKPLDLFVYSDPPVDGGEIGIALGKVVPLGVEKMIAHRHQKIAPRREVAVEIALRGSRPGCDVLNSAVSRSSISELKGTNIRSGR